MKITAEKDQQSQFIVRIEIEPVELDEAKGKAAKRLSNRLRIPGFRPGKAPRALVERFVGQESLVEEATRDLMPKALKQALEQETIKPIAEPEYKIESMDPLTIVLTIPVEPTVTLGNYKEIKFEMPTVELEEEEVEKTIQQLREQNSTWEEPAEERPAQDGDQVEIELQTVREDETTGEPFNRTGVLGKGELLEQIDSQIVGMAAGEERVITINRDEPKTGTPDTGAKAEDGPENQAGAAEGEAAAIAASQVNAENEISPVALDLPEVETIPLDPAEEAGEASTEPMTFKVKLNSIKVKNEPALDDTFAASVSDLPTMDALRERVRSNLKAQKEADAKRELVDKIVKEAVEQSSVEMPPVMVNAEIHSLENNMAQRLQQQKLNLDQYLGFLNKTHEEFHEELRPQAEGRIKNAMVLREIAQKEGVTVEESDIDQEVERMVAEYSSAAPEETRAEQAGRIREIFNQKETRERMADEVFSRKLGDFLIEMATGVAPTPPQSLELEIKNDPNAATAASEEKLERTQGEVEMDSSRAAETETAPEKGTPAAAEPEPAAGSPAEDSSAAQTPGETKTA